MNDPQGTDPITVTTDGVTVTKRYEADEFPVPAIAFVFESTRSESVSVLLTDTVPEGVAVDELGFHPEYGSEHWSIDEDGIVFEYELAPHGEYTTVYGLRATGTEDIDRFLSEPMVTADPVGDETAADDSSAEAAADDGPAESAADDSGVEGAIDHGSTDIPADDGVAEPSVDGEQEASTTSVETEEGEDAGDPSAGSEANGSTEGSGPTEDDGAEATAHVDDDGDEDGSDGSEDDDGGITEISLDNPDAPIGQSGGPDLLDIEGSSENGDDGAFGLIDDSDDVETDETLGDESGPEHPDEPIESSIVARFARELEAGEVDPADVRRIRAAFDQTAEAGTTISRVRKLQGDLDDVLAYRDTLEEIIDESGGGDVIRDLREEVTSIQKRLEVLEAAVEKNDENLSTVVNHVGSIDDAVDDLSESLESVQGDVEALEAWREQLSSVIGGE